MALIAQSEQIEGIVSRQLYGPGHGAVRATAELYTCSVCVLSIWQLTCSKQCTHVYQTTYIGTSPQDKMYTCIPHYKYRDLTSVYNVHMYISPHIPDLTRST